MPKRLNLQNKRFGRLTVTLYKGKGRWDCLCDCGNGKSILTSSLTSGRTISCGCYNREISGSAPKFKPGEKVGVLKLVDVAGRGKDRSVNWQCVCDCGTSCTKTMQQLTRSKNLNCGSLVHQNRKTKIVPPTPTPYPEEAAKIFAEFAHRLKRFDKWGWAEDIATEALLRAAYIIHWREQQGFPIESPAAYIEKALGMVKVKHLKEKHRELIGRESAKMGRIKISIGGEMTNTTFQAEAVAQAETQPNNCLPAPRRVKKFRRC